PGEIWVNFGYLRTIDGGGHIFDRYIRYYTGQVLGYIPQTQKKAYIVGRYSKVETMSATEGYSFQGTQIAGGRTTPYAAYNFDQRDLYRWSLGAGYWIHKNILAKVEYSWEDSHLIQSAIDANPSLLAFRGHHNFAVAELSVKF